MEMTECLQNSRFFGKIISEYLSEVKLKLDIFLNQNTILLLTYFEKRQILRLRRLVIQLLIKTLILY